MSDNIYVPGKGNFNAKIAFVGEAPSYDEVNQLEPFVGPSGRFLNQMLKDAGIARDECWVTNTCKYELTPLAKGAKRKFSERVNDIGIDWNQQIDELRSELLQINPNVIVPSGCICSYGQLLVKAKFKS